MSKSSTFWTHFNEARKEIRLVLAVNDDQHRREAHKIAIFSVRKLLKILSGMEEVHAREKAAIAVFNLVSWQGRYIIPEVLEKVNAIFNGDPPGPVSVQMKRLEQIRAGFVQEKRKSKQRECLRKVFFYQSLYNAQEDFSSGIFHNEDTEVTRAIIVSVIRGLLAQLPKMSKQTRVACVVKLLEFAARQNEVIITEAIEMIQAAFEGDLPKKVASKIANLAQRCSLVQSNHVCTNTQ